MGLVKQVVTSLYKVTIKRLTKVFHHDMLILFHADYTKIRLCIF